MAQEESKSTSEILKLAGCNLRIGTASVIPQLRSLSPISPFSSPKECDFLRDRISVTSFPVLVNKSLSTLVSYTPSSPYSNVIIDDNVRLPGRLGSMSSAEACTSSLVLSKLDGLDRVASQSSSVQNDGSMDSSDEIANMVAKSSSAVSVAMEKAHAHANRIKTNKLRRKHHRSSGATMSSHLSIVTADSRLSILARSQSIIAQLPSAVVTGVMPLWVQRKIAAERGSSRMETFGNDQDSSAYFGQYELHSSETVITHHLNRGNWTWKTEWSPDGNYLAMATENHGLAVVDARPCSPVWKVVNDNRNGKVKNDTTQSIRAIAWGGSYIALGGTGDAVSIVEPCMSSVDGTIQSSFEIVHVITDTGFVGALCWLKSSNMLAIGNRDDQCLIADVRRGLDGAITSTILHTIERSDWVSALQFSHGGTKLAIGDRSGLLSIYFFVIIRHGEAPALSPLKDIPLGDSILDIQWSPDGKLIYSGGEDYAITIIDTVKYTVQRKIGRDRWVSFLAPSRGGTHLAAGGGSHQVSLFDVNMSWGEVTSLRVNGGIPLHATWHPTDEYVAVCGQFNDVVVYESSHRRLLKGKCFRSKSSILAVQFSPDGKLLAVGNEQGLVTFFDVSTSEFVTLYETVVGIGSEMNIEWSPDGNNIAIACGRSFVLLDTLYRGKEGIHPLSNARFLVRKILHSGTSFTTLAFSPNSQFLAVSSDQMTVLDLENGCSCVRVLHESNALSCAWSEDSSVFATVCGRSALSIYDVTSTSPENWKQLLTISFKLAINSLCWGPSVTKGLYYLAFGGENETMAVLEIRSHEKIWETVIQVPCHSKISVLRWHSNGMLCIGNEDGTVSTIDLFYLKSGKTVCEMSYNWQRQGIISTTKLTRNFGRNSITSLCWLPNSSQTDKIHLAIGGSDGIFEIVDFSDQSDNVVSN
jgi:WD40 repeat protein